MTIPMDKVYSQMTDVYADAIECSIKNGERCFKITFDSFRIGMKQNGLVNNKITAKEKWERALLDGVLIPLGVKTTSAMVDVPSLLSKSGINKNKYIFSERKSQTVKEDA